MNLSIVYFDRCYQVVCKRCTTFFVNLNVFVTSSRFRLFFSVKCFFSIIFSFLTYNLRHVHKIHFLFVSLVVNYRFLIRSLRNFHSKFFDVKHATKMGLFASPPILLSFIRIKLFKCQHGSVC